MILPAFIKENKLLTFLDNDWIHVVFERIFEVNSNQ
jgi:hypothetical protein